MSTLSHIDSSGRARMVDVSAKQATARTASARGIVTCKPETLDRVRAGMTPKGAVVQTAELAGVMAAKRTAELIPLCHPLQLTRIDVRIGIDDALPGFRVDSEVSTKAETGVEMEALTAVSVACLTIYDMIKAVERGVRIEGIHLVEKKGGKSGHYLVTEG
jgi:cyclic pyranopterin phosphate synthase